jgi:hypothetical protein
VEGSKKIVGLSEHHTTIDTNHSPYVLYDIPVRDIPDVHDKDDIAENVYSHDFYTTYVGGIQPHRDAVRYNEAVPAYIVTQAGNRAHAFGNHHRRQKQPKRITNPVL